MRPEGAHGLVHEVLRGDRGDLVQRLEREGLHVVPAAARWGDRIHDRQAVFEQRGGEPLRMEIRADGLGARELHRTRRDRHVEEREPLFTGQEHQDGARALERGDLVVTTRGPERNPACGLQAPVGPREDLQAIGLEEEHQRAGAAHARRSRARLRGRHRGDEPATALGRPRRGEVVDLYTEARADQVVRPHGDGLVKRSSGEAEQARFHVVHREGDLVAHRAHEPSPIHGGERHVDGGEIGRVREPGLALGPGDDDRRGTLRGEGSGVDAGEVAVVEAVVVDVGVRAPEPAHGERPSAGVPLDEVGR